MTPLVLTAAEIRTVIELLPDYLLFADTERHILSMSRSPWSEGLQDRVGRDFLDFVKPEHQAMVMEAVRRVLAGESLVELEFEGAITGRWVHARIGAVREHSRVSGLVLHLRDVEELMLLERERARLQAALSAGKKPPPSHGRLVPERFAQMADALPILIAYVDREQCYRYNNAGYERWFGVGRQSLLGRKLEDVIGAAAYAAIGGYVASALEGRMVSVEMELPYHNAGPRQVFVRFVPDVTPEGDIPGYFVLTEDVTEQREALARLRQREEELRQQQKMEALGSLATGIAHEFNNLLQAIIGGCQVLRCEQLDKVRRGEQTERLLRTAQRGITLTRQLLSLGRLKSLDDRPLLLDSLLHDMAILLAPLLGSSIELQSHLHSGCGIVADAGQIQQIVMNLAINARDAMPCGGCLSIETRYVRLRPEEASALGLFPGPHACLSITDNGQGMTEDIRKRIFEPFFTTKPEGQGTGLGLSTVLGMMQRMRGHIEVQSSPGGGTTFRLYFPCLEKNHEEAPDLERATLDPSGGVTEAESGGTRGGKRGGKSGTSGASCAKPTQGRREDKPAA